MSRTVQAPVHGASNLTVASTTLVASAEHCAHRARVASGGVPGWHTVPLLHPWCGLFGGWRMRNQQGAVWGTCFPGTGNLAPAPDCDMIKAVTEEGQPLGPLPGRGPCSQEREG